MVDNANCLTAADNYRWIWEVKKVNNKPDEKVPMEVGDRLYICICDGVKVEFRQRSSKDRANTPLWDGAAGSFCAETGTIEGTLTDKRTFKMHIEVRDGHLLLISKHKRNPDEGEWEGQQPGGTN